LTASFLRGLRLDRHLPHRSPALADPLVRSRQPSPRSQKKTRRKRQQQKSPRNPGQNEGAGSREFHRAHSNKMDTSGNPGMAQTLAVAPALKMKFLHNYQRNSFFICPFSLKEMVFASGLSGASRMAYQFSGRKPGWRGVLACVSGAGIDASDQSLRPARLRPETVVYSLLGTTCFNQR
jgi:hypothetical protein